MKDMVRLPIMLTTEQLGNSLTHYLLLLLVKPEEDLLEYTEV
jgi:hypothetical protein